MTRTILTEGLHANDETFGQLNGSVADLRRANTFFLARSDAFAGQMFSKLIHISINV